MTDPDPDDDRKDAARLRRAVDNAKILATELARARSERPDTVDPIPSAPGAVAPRPSARVTRTDPAPAEPATSRPRAAVVAWDLAHNPAGRALVLHDLLAATHDTVLMGPLWAEHGREVWRPLRDHQSTPITFPADDYTAFFAHAFAVAGRSVVDTVHVGKPRLPSMVLGAMVQQANGAAVVLDIDDEETAFFPAGSGAGTDAFEDPTGAAATAWAVAQIAHAPVGTVSNVVLADRYGGIIVRHARDEERFSPTGTDRSAGRARLHATDDEFVVLFVGTPRPHKGLDQVIEALALLDDPDVVLHLVGAGDPEAVQTELGSRGARIRVHPPCGFDTLPDLLAAADALALLQDADDPIARHQIPAKIGDGLALGTPVFVADTPPLADLHGCGLTVVDGPEGLARSLRELIDHPGDDDAARRRRHGFLTEFSNAVNAPRIALAHREAATIDGTAFARAVLEPTIDGYRRRRRLERPDLFADRPDPPPVGVDVAFFWKQHDSDIYGRRADMIAAAMADSTRFGRIVHFEPPVDIATMAGELDRPPAELPEETALTHRNILDRHLHLLDRPGFSRRTFVYSATGGRDPLTGEVLPALADHPAWVHRQLTEAGLDPSRTLAWVCPIVPAIDDVLDEISFGALVCDVIDDQRVLNPRRSDAGRIDEAYATLLRRADAVFTNCEPNVAAFAEHAGVMHVVPNGADLVGAAAARAHRSPPEGEGRRVIYVGDMRSRIDWTLLEEAVAALPECDFVFVGSTDGVSDSVTRLRDADNVRFAGVVPHTEVGALLADADVAIVPHLRGPMTDRMNPLKVYTYLAAGLPVVATAVGNIDDVGGAVTVVEGAAAFADAVRDVRLAPDIDLAGIDWEDRLDAMIGHLDAGGVLQKIDGSHPQ